MKYVLDLLAKTGKMGAKPYSTPMIPNICLTKDDGDPYDDPERYRRLVGKLNYLMVITRPDIAFAVSLVSQFMSAPMVKHWPALKQILYYLKGTHGLGILYRDHGHVGKSRDYCNPKAQRKNKISLISFPRIQVLRLFHKNDMKLTC